MANNYIGNNFPTGSETKVETKYLNFQGLRDFLAMAKGYIDAQDTKLFNATKAKLDTLSQDLESLLAIIGESELDGGTLADNIAKILGQYVKDIKQPTTQELPLKISVEEGTGTNKDIYTISLVDNGLADKLNTLTSARVSKITTDNDGGAITLTADKNTGDVKLTINSKALTERVESLESERIKSITESGSTENYVKLDVNTNALQTTIKIDDSTLATKISNIEQNISTETQNRTNADSGLDSRLTDVEEGLQTETEQRNTADLALGTRIDNLEGNLNSYKETVQSTYLPLTGGTLTGDLTVTGPTKGANDRPAIILQRGALSSDTYVDWKMFNNGGPLTFQEGRNNANTIVLNITSSGSSDAKEIQALNGWKFVGNLTGNVIGNVTGNADTATDASKLGGQGPSYYAKQADQEEISAKLTTLTDKHAIDLEALNQKDQQLSEAIATINGKTYVNTFGGKSGAITVRSGSTTVGDVNFSMSNNQLTATTVLPTDWVKDITAQVTTKDNKNLISLTETENAGTSTITLNETKLVEEIEEINTAISENTILITDNKTALENADKALDERLDTIENSYVKSVKTSNSNTGTKYVTITPTAASKGDIEIKIDDSGVKDKFGTIDSYKINGKSIKDSPNLTGDDITLGVSVGDNTNYPTTMKIPAAIQELRETIAGLGQVLELKGILVSLPSTTTGYANGDVVIVGNKEYVCYEGEWKLLGDVTELSEDLSTLISKYNTHKHTVNVSGDIEATFTGGNNTTSGPTGLQNVSLITNSGSLPTKEEKSAASSDHTHTISLAVSAASGGVESIFTGTQKSTDQATSNEISVNSITSAGSKPTRAEKSMPTSDHTHTISVGVTGTVNSEFTGTAASHNHTFTGNSNTTSNSGPSVSYAAGKLTITMGHTHTVTPTGTIANTSVTPAGSVASTLTNATTSGNSGEPNNTETIYSITGLGSIPTFSNVTFDLGAHTHTYTPAGSVTSTLKDDVIASGTSGTPSATVEFNSITNVGSKITYSNYEVASSEHTHTVTPTGSVTGTFIENNISTGESNQKA